MIRRMVVSPWLLVTTWLALVSYVSCQTSTASSAKSSSSSTATTKARTQTVTVGVVSTNAAGSEVHVYQPNRINAAVGDTIVFAFLPGGHAVIRSEYTGSSSCPNGYCNPCAPWESYHPNQAGFGFASGNFQPSDSNLSQTWNYTVTDSKPMFIYCNATRSCSPGGMVGVINGDETVDLTKQIKAAQDSQYQLSPGQALPANFTVNPNTVSSSNTTNSTSSPAASSAGNSSGGGLSSGAIAGIVVGAVVILLLAAALFYFVGRNKSLKNEVDHHREGGGGSQFGGSNSVPSKAGWAPGIGRDEMRMSQQAHNMPLYDPHTGQPNNRNSQHRVSGMTYYSHGATSPVLPDQSTGQFIGYNRQTGAPEFAAEAEAPVAGGRYEPARINSYHASDAHKSPLSPRISEHEVYTDPNRRMAARNSHFGELMGDVPGNGLR